ncbi:MAG: protein kinase domain-containing protein [Hyphomicrobiaceae bacterium]
MRDDRRRLAPGKRLDGKYVIKKTLGAGGFGITYLAWDELLRRSVAIKEYFPNDVGLWRSGVGRDWFLDEGRNLTRLHHPNIVRVVNYFNDAGTQTAYIVMEHVEGISLRDYLTKYGDRTRQGALPFNRLKPIAAGLVAALRHVHAKGLVHSDISLNNVLIADTGPVLIDFGAARQAAFNPDLTGPRVATPGFASPEQYVPDAKMKFQNDIYALGAVLYACVTGAPPPPAPKRLEGEPYTPAAIAARKYYPREFLAAIDRALDLDPNRRVRSVEEFGRDLFHRPVWPKLAASLVLGLVVVGTMVLAKSSWTEAYNRAALASQSTGELARNNSQLNEEVRRLQSQLAAEAKSRQHAQDAQKAAEVAQKAKAKQLADAQQQWEAEKKQHEARLKEAQDRTRQLVAELATAREAGRTATAAPPKRPLPGDRSALGAPRTIERTIELAVIASPSDGFAALRQGPDLNSKKLAELKPLTKLIWHGVEQGQGRDKWRQVMVGDLTGWIHISLIEQRVAVQASR